MPKVNESLLSIDRVSPLLLAAMGASALLFAVVVNVQRVQATRAASEAAQARYEQTAAAAQQIAAYRERAAASGPSEAPEEDVAALVLQALNDADIPASREQRLTSSAPIRVNVGGRGDDRQVLEDRVEGEFAPMTPAEVWDVLAAWRALDVSWRPVSLVMVQSNRRGDDPVYSATIGFANRYEPTNPE